MAQKYLIKEICADGYERFAAIEGMEHDVRLNVHFYQYDEYIENGEEPRKKKKDDILIGDLSIELVTICEKVNKELFHCQELKNSPHIEAVVEVVQIIDEYSFYAKSSMINDAVLIEFEAAGDYEKGDRVFVKGELKLYAIK